MLLSLATKEAPTITKTTIIPIIIETNKGKKFLIIRLHLKPVTTKIVRFYTPCECGFIHTNRLNSHLTLSNTLLSSQN